MFISALSSLLPTYAMIWEGFFHFLRNLLTLFIRPHEIRINFCSVFISFSFIFIISSISLGVPWESAWNLRKAILYIFCLWFEMRSRDVKFMVKVFKGNSFRSEYFWIYLTFGSKWMPIICLWNWGELMKGDFEGN